MAKRILVLGSGFAGLWAAIGAARRRVELGLNVDDIEITVVTREPFHDIRVRHYEADLEASRLPLRNLLDPVSVRTVVGEVDDIDVADSAVRVGGASPRRLGYDRLVVALGSRLVRPPIPGFGEYAFNIDSWRAASRLRVHLESLTAGPSRADAATVVVVGAGLTGIEVATEMVDRLDRLWSGLPAHPAGRVVLVDHNPHVGSDMGDDARPVIERALGDLGIETVTGAKVTAIRPEGIELDGPDAAGHGARLLPAATVIWCAGMRANPVVTQLPVEPDHLGRLEVDDYLRVRNVDRVFAAGDVARAQMDESHVSVMSCQHSRPMGRYAGCNVVSDLVGEPMRGLRIPWYVTVLDLGRAGAVYTEGWDRRVVTTGDDAKTTKRIINTERIYPPASGDRDELLRAAAPEVQEPPAYGSNSAEARVRRGNYGYW